MILTRRDILNHDIYSSLTQIMVDGHDIRTLQLEWWRSQVSLVSQEPTLFYDSVYANIAMSKPGELYTFFLAKSIPE
jgi:ABC-type multidrug transport system fused ATPase/permease subunit